jgi:hypothetical protein
MATFREPIARTEYHIDGDGIPVFVRHRDMVGPISVDWTDALVSGETVSSSTWATDGVTTSGAALATPVATITVTGTDGSVTNTVVTSTSRTLVRVIRFRGVEDGHDTSSDY